MSAPTPVAVADARRSARSRYERLAVAWATTDGVPDPAWDVPLHPPTQSRVLADPAGAVQWVEQWRAVDGVLWAERRWASVGDQQVPERLVLQTAADLARFAGHEQHWRRLSSRVLSMADRWGDVVRPVLRRHATVLLEQDEQDVARLVAAVDWLTAHPRSGLYLRQLPVEGLSTKWVERRRALVSGLVTAVTGLDGLGLADAPAVVRVRALDPALAPDGLRDVAAPVDQLDAWERQPRTVVVVENLQTYLALPPLPGVMAVHGSGYAADLLGRIRWVRESEVVYWGDLDRDGFAILDRLRAHCPDVTSVLMDEGTLLSHRHLWTADPGGDSGTTLTRLTPQEQHTLELIRAHGGVRLEQERLRWPECVAALTAATRPG